MGEICSVAMATQGTDQPGCAHRTLCGQLTHMFPLVFPVCIFSRAPSSHYDTHARMSRTEPSSSLCLLVSTLIVEMVIHTDDHEELTLIVRCLMYLQRLLSKIGHVDSFNGSAGECTPGGSLLNPHSFPSCISRPLHP